MENPIIKVLSSQELSTTGFWKKLFGIDKRNCFLKKFQKLISERSIAEISKEDINALYKECSMGFFAKNVLLLLKLTDLMEEVILETAKNFSFRYFGEEICHLLKIFELPYQTGQLKKARKKAFEILVKKAVEDRKFSDGEKEELAKASEYLMLNKEEVEKIYSQVVLSVVNNYINEAIKKGVWSPKDEEILLSFCKEFNILIDLDEKSKKLLERLRLAWEIERGNYPEYKVDINLRKEEICHFYEKATRLEYRKEVRRSSSRAYVSFRVMKGVYLTQGFGGHTYSTEVLKEVDQGTVYLTNKRILFQGRKRNISIPFSKILTFEPQKTGVIIHKDSGKPIHLEFENSDIFNLLLSKFLENGQEN